MYLNCQRIKLYVPFIVNFIAFSGQSYDFENNINWLTAKTIIHIFRMAHCPQKKKKEKNNFFWFHYFINIYSNLYFNILILGNEKLTTCQNILTSNYELKLEQK